MKKIILASGSKQRKKLLKMLGVKFTVRPANVDEKKKITTNCANLVVENALLKARDVAGKVKDGIVIGSDTVVYVGRNQIVGKPKNYKDARRILRLLFAQPQWVYTGIAVIDAKTGRTVTDYEKTKVFMVPLSDQEIKNYHAKVNPFDKAGGFDIEGWGSIFIHRIEGCYSNVIGLPMAKLFKMLKKFGVSVLGVLMIAIFSGCQVTEYNLATKQKELILYSTDKEVNMGFKFSQRVEEQLEMAEDVDLNEKAKAILDKIVAVCDRKDILYFIKIIDREEINALALPGGYIYIFKGVFDNADNDDQVAGVIAHEVAHINAKHAIKRVQGAYAALALQVAAAETGNVRAANIALNSLFTAYSQHDEYEADRLGVRYMKRAGYDPNEMVKFMEKIMAEQEKSPLKDFTYWKTHPNPAKRMAVIRQEISGSVDFRGYLNLTGSEYQ